MTYTKFLISVRIFLSAYSEKSEKVYKLIFNFLIMNKRERTVALVVIAVLILGAFSLVILKNVFGNSNDVTGKTISGNVVADSVVNNNVNTATNPTTNTAPTPAINNKPTPPTYNPSLSPSLDVNPPVITLNGPDTVILNINDTYTEQGATVTDDKDAGLNTVTITGTVDTSTPGTYIISYYAADYSGNPTTVTRTVNVV